MGLSTALTTSLSGLRTTQSGIELVSSNVANVNTRGYTKKNIVLESDIIADRSAGVRVAAITREIDTYVQRQLRTETSGLAFSSVASNYLGQLQSLYGTPGGANSLDKRVGDFTNALDALATTPSSQSARQDVLNQAKLMVQQLKGMSSSIQSMRQDADRGISNTVDRVNASLQGLEKVQQQIGVMTAAGQDVSPDILDQRDLFISELSEYVDVRVSEVSGRLSIYTTGGAALFVDNTASELKFEGPAAMVPHALYSEDPAERNIGTVLLIGPDGQPKDLLAGDKLRSGELKAYVELRDNILVEAQRQLDELASSMAEALGTTPVNGVANGTGFDLDVSDIQPGNKMTLTYDQLPGGQSRTVTFVAIDDPSLLPLANDVTADPNDTVYGIDFSGGPASVAAQMQAALGTDFVVTNTGSTITFDAATAAVDVTGASARATATALTGDGLALPFFLDGGSLYTNSLEGGGQRLGFASRIQLNEALVNDPALLVNYQTPTASGDAARATFLRDALENPTLQYRSDTGVGGTNSPFTGSIADFARTLIETQASNADIASRVQEGQEVVVTSLQDRFIEKSGVDVDEEMAKLLQLQSAYAANARVISTVKEMIDILLAM
ncbi:flagellar hook-associated protein FlgK [Terrihabitans soli]|uniref:Flagellar hook-associated protein 1 n=1 Tax=Terrihabitans soli TaxID=708113 RepID=A0A6S6QX81_9HYPH|nr:flagellar hook-associated protein FlgK [Terrihabitans soli]BCJ91631.1 flagellar hook-associated protein FlgK [Terrihabitans soli]